VKLKDIPEEYHDFMDVFSKTKADTLAPHRPSDLKIQLEDGVFPPQPLIYLLLTSELTTLREFLDKHLSMGYIWPVRGQPLLRFWFRSELRSELRFLLRRLIH
jgi:hypothetical protein